MVYRIYQGKIVKYFVDKGYGFIESEVFPEPIYFRNTAIQGLSEGFLYSMIVKNTLRDSGVYPHINVNFRVISKLPEIRAIDIQLTDEYRHFLEIERFLNSEEIDKTNVKEQFLNRISFETLNQLFSDLELTSIVKEKIIKSNNVYNTLQYISGFWNETLSVINGGRNKLLSIHELDIISKFSRKLSRIVSLNPIEDIEYKKEIPLIIQPLNKSRSPLKCIRESEEFSILILKDRDVLNDLIQNENRIIFFERRKLKLIFLLIDDNNKNIEITDKLNIAIIPHRYIFQSIMNNGDDSAIIVGRLLRNSLPTANEIQKDIMQPFDINTTYQSHLFFGRTHEKKKILNNKTSNIAIYGGRQIGKTWLLLDICDSCINDKEYSQQYFPIYISLQSAKNTDDAIFYITEKIANETGFVSSAKNNLRNLGNSLIHLHKASGKIILLALDEIDKVLTSPDHWSLFERLRQLQSTYPLSFKFIFAGFKELIHVAYEEIDENPFFNWLGDNHFSLGFLSLNEVKGMVRQFRWLGLEFDEEQIINKIYDLTSGHPYYTQDLCYKIAESKLNEPYFNLSPQNIEKFANQEWLKEIFSTFSGNLSNLQRLIGKIFSIEDRVFSELEISKSLQDMFGINIGIKKIKEEMDVLQACSIFTRNVEGYTPANKWINTQFFKQFDEEELAIIYLERPDE